MLGADYVGTARSKGAAGVSLFRGHVLRNAAIPTVSIIGVNLGYLVGGSLVIEKVFAIPGLGSLMINAIFARDFPTIQAVALFVALFVDRRRDPHRRRLHAHRPAGRPRPARSAHDHGGGGPTATRAMRRPARSRSLQAWYRNGTLVAGLGHRRAAGARRDPRAAAHALRPDQAGPRRTRCSRRAREHWLGTDKYGRDVLTRLLYGARVDLRIGFLAVLIPFVVGSVLGALAGYFGGWFDTIVMRVVDVFFAFPFYVLVIVLVFVLGSGERSIYLAIARSPGSPTPRSCAGEVLVAKKPGLRRRRPGSAACRTAGSWSGTSGRTCCPRPSSTRWRHRHGHHGDRHPGLPRAWASRRRPPEWGAMILDGQEFITTLWLQATIPGLAVVVTSLGLSLTR